MTEQKASRGWQGAMVALWRPGDYLLTVTGRREISPHYLRLSFDAGGLLADNSLHPTMWIRMWFPDGNNGNNGNKLHHRGYTLVNPDPAVDTVDVEFALHGGVASRWAQGAQPRDTIEATVLGTKFAIPIPPPAGYVIVGDTASLPAINSLLEAIEDAPARVFLEAGNRGDKDLPIARDADVTWVDREDHGAALVQTVKSAAFPAADHFGWVACDSRTTRSVSRVLHNDFGIPRRSIAARGYWTEGRTVS